MVRRRGYNLFAKAAVRDLNHDLAFPGAQRLEAFPEGGQSFFILPPSAIAREAEPASSCTDTLSRQDTKFRQFLLLPTPMTLIAPGP